MMERLAVKKYEVKDKEMFNKVNIEVSNVDVQEDYEIQENEVLSIDNQEDSNNDVEVQSMSPPSITPVGSQVDTHRRGFKKRLDVIKNRFSKMSRRAVVQFLKKK